MIDIHPTVCNLCGGKVIYKRNSIHCKFDTGGGHHYFCTQCRATVGTNKLRPREALGLLADKEMKEWRRKCHVVFDRMWKKEKVYAHYVRRQCYEWLAEQLGIPVEDCHFGHGNT